jgi:hypothetical protein
MKIIPIVLIMVILEGCATGSKIASDLRSSQEQTSNHTLESNRPSGALTPVDNEGDSMQIENTHKQQDTWTSEYAKAVVDYLACEYVLLHDDDDVTGKWEELSQQGKREGFYPLIISPERVLNTHLG